jgi:hypothetical protein
MIARARWLILPVCCVLGRVAQAAPVVRGDSTYHDHLDAARAAELANDDSLARTQLLRALDLIHGHPDVVYLLARVETRLGHPDSAIARLRTIAAMGIAYDAAHDPMFESLHENAAFDTVVRAMDLNRRQIGASPVVLTLGDADALAEDMVYDGSTHTFYVSSVHRRKILALPEQGAPRDFATATRDSLDAVMALAIDPKRHVLWATTVGVPQQEGYAAADSARAAVLRYDLRTGRLLHRYPLPADGRHHDPGDMTVDPAGTVILSDATGSVYTIPVRTDSLVLLIGPGTFHSPQTPAVAPDGRIFVADYARGIGSIDPRTHAVEWLAHADTVALSGIDGMYLSGHTLLAIQNGTDPPRVVRFELDPQLRRVVSWSVIERGTPHLGQPTHGAVVGDTFYFIGNSGWERFDEDGSLVPDPGRTAPMILRAPVHGGT